ncbi:hypothetical protein POVWA2_027740 [Plasmodium ovale wallikeri]|uniref:Uncharacterized protein n=1 Tax=Plasmodium ovale wallikeri TaxID=864142 RepID=A0A1A8YVB7_PLAOA|nr:hypothetical protein POVWA1_027580 [Plasmodium ovale wallikeri]SBT35978.1 hypothetical protein POVWA2_027740 [Plasmodium ovale wallikeri]
MKLSAFILPSDWRDHQNVSVTVGQEHITLLSIKTLPWNSLFQRTKMVGKNAIKLLQKGGKQSEENKVREAK